MSAPIVAVARSCQRLSSDGHRRLAEPLGGGLRLRLSIRWKLVLGVGLPLLALSAAFVVWQFFDRRHQAVREVEALLEERARHYATRFDARFATIAQVACSTAAFIEVAPDLTQAQIDALLTAALRHDPLIYGACVAFKPFGFSAERRLFAPYVFRDNGATRRIDVAEAYDYVDGEQSWYRDAKAAKHPIWTEPFFDADAGNIKMCTHVVPFYDGDEFGGVANVDVPLAELQDETVTLDLASGIFVIVSAKGTFISHPNPNLIMKASVASLARAEGLVGLVELHARTINGASGVRRIPNLVDGKAAFLAFAPIPSTGWAFGAAIPEEDVLEPVYEDVLFKSVLLASLIAATIAFVLFIAVRILRPIGGLADSVKEVAAGNLQIRTSFAKSHDEIGDLARAFDKMIVDLRHHIDARTKDATERERIASELSIARQIQNSLLPRQTKASAERVEFELSAMNAPARTVAGDFFDHFFVGPRKLAFLIADVSGKGVPAALLMAVTRTAIRNLSSSCATPAALLHAVNDYLLRDQDSGLFVTIFVAYYDLDSQVLEYSNAGHLAPFLVRRGRPNRRLDDAAGPPVGVIETLTWENGRFPLAMGESLVLFTDGVTEGRDPDGKFFGDQRLEAFLTSSEDASAADLCKGIVDAVSTFQRGNLKDDVTVLVFGRVEVAKTITAAR